MLGMRIEDPHGVEDRAGEMPGIGLLPIFSVMEKNKITKRASDLFKVPGNAAQQKLKDMKFTWEEHFRSMMLMYCF